ncbi:hypothetical protein MHU86_3356 [Fragilaria crotonensis]|nr:hypothetical protein MHU86_3356 [Fragilaria crotonensis]
MGPRPADFDEVIVRQSPTYQKWETLAVGASLRYACRDFVKGHGDDEERLMRRIMIARRNNLRDHDALKRARAVVTTLTAPAAVAAAAVAPTTTAADAVEVPAPKDPDVPVDAVDQEKKFVTVKEEDGTNDDTDNNDSQNQASVVERRLCWRTSYKWTAVEATRSYKTWQALEEGKEFIYNQKYVKGRPTHDWLLRKNIWRRMRYRRENKKMVQAVLSADGLTTAPSAIVAFSSVSAGDREDDDDDDGAHDGQGGVGAGLVDDALLASAAAAVDKVQHIHKSVVDAAVAAAESYVKSNVDTEQVSV